MYPNGCIILCVSLVSNLWTLSWCYNCVYYLSNVKKCVCDIFQILYSGISMMWFMAVAVLRSTVSTLELHVLIPQLALWITHWLFSNFLHMLQPLLYFKLVVVFPWLGIHSSRVDFDDCHGLSLASQIGVDPFFTDLSYSHCMCWELGVKNSCNKILVIINIMYARHYRAIFWGGGGQD